MKFIPGGARELNNKFIPGLARELTEERADVGLLECWRPGLSMAVATEAGPARVAGSG